MNKLMSWFKYLLLLVLLLNSGCVFYSTKPNEVGVRTKKVGLLGDKGVMDTVYAPGSTYIFLPFINEWNTFDINLQNMEMTMSLGKGDIKTEDDLNFKTIDGNDISLDLIVVYRVNPEKAPHILSYVAKNDSELRQKIVRVVARSFPRDIFGQLKTEDFYSAELRALRADLAKDHMNRVLNPYGVIIERVLTQDYRFNSDYQKAIEDRKVADQKTEKLKSEKDAKEEEYNRKLEHAAGEVFKMKAAADGEYAKAVIAADAYYNQQASIAKAIEAEGLAESEGIKKLNEALAVQGGKVMVKLKMAEALNGKKIFLLPSGSGNSIDLKTLDVNKFLEMEGIKKAAQSAKK